MSLLSRFSKLALLVFALLALTATLGTWSPHSSGWLSVTPAWASSPDETLNPPANPPKSKAAAMHWQTSAQSGVTSAVSARTQAVSVRTYLGRLVIVWKVSLASVLRF